MHGYLEIVMSLINERLNEKMNTAWGRDILPNMP